MAVVHDRDHLTEESSGGTLGVMALGDDPIEEFAAGAELHDEVNGVAVLICSFEFDDVAVAGKVVHDLHLAADVVDVIMVNELARGDGLAGERFAGPLVDGEVGDPELAAAELATKGVGGPDVLDWPAQYAAQTSLTLTLR